MKLYDGNYELHYDQKEIRNAPIEFPISCYYVDLSKTEVDWHWHEEFEIIQVQKGKVSVMVGETECILKAGEGIFINGNTLHALKKIRGVDAIVHSEVFHPRLVAGDWESIFWKKYIFPITNNPSMEAAIFREEKDWNKTMLFYAEKAWNACRQEKKGYEFYVREYLSRIVLNIKQHCGCEFVEKRSKSEILRGERMRQMLQYIQEHFSDEMTGEEIAKSANISVSESLRCFKKMIGIPPLQYVKSQRLEHAYHLLRSSDLKVSEVAFACGFHDMSYFTKEFKKAYQLTPSKYRANCKEAQQKIKEQLGV